ncbi:MAG: acyl-CoA dehydrogenase family protein, partial [Pseudomonadota bacterium]|nr:acyl-CoA dehydrogenase family protein [Pseudomonadota bacterium]
MMDEGGKVALDGEAGDIAADKPIFDPQDWRLSDFESALCAETRQLAQAKFAPRAAIIDREARFPTENYADLRAAGLLGICIPAEHGGRGADLRAYMLAAAEIGRYCGATALTFNMHVSSCLWTGFLADGVEMTAAQRSEHAIMRARHYRRILD